MRSSTIAFLSALLILLLGQPLAVSAQETSGTQQKYVKIRLLPERAAIAPGEEIWVGIEQSIHPGWHTYWRNPGDSGSDPRVKWTLPEGFSVSEIHWPTPKKLPFGPMTNYGYENNVILLQKLKAPDSLPEGPLSFSAMVDVLVCHDICIPEFGTYDMTLNAAQEGEDNAPYLLEAQTKLPMDAPEQALLRKLEDAVELEIPSAAWCNHGDNPCAGIEMFPLEWGIVNNAAPPRILFDGTKLSIRQEAGERDWAELNEPRFLITYTDAQGQKAGIEFVAAMDAPGIVFDMDDIRTGPSLPLVLLLALVGGLILNLMPCVFPVLSLKALSLIKTAQKNPAQARLHGISYTAGVIASFLAIAGILMALQAAGAQIGWGFQLQNPIVITLLIYLLFAIGLNLMGFFEVPSRLENIGGKLAGGKGVSGSFFTGILATIVATPCTAPFMGAAIGFALTQNAFISLIVFAFLGLGLALPYLALSFVPALQRLLPKPGKWMETFRQFLSFPIFLTCVWLLWVLSQQVGPAGILGAALGVTSLTFALWLAKTAPSSGLWRRIVRILAILSALAALGFMPLGADISSTIQTSSIQSFGEVYSAAKLEEALAGDFPVFVEMTAAWCITCKVNHATSLNIESTKKLFAEKGIKFLVGDWTNYDPAITEFLNRFGRNGVPIYVYYAPPSPETKQRPEPVLLPQILTPGLVAGALK